MEVIHLGLKIIFSYWAFCWIKRFCVAGINETYVIVILFAKEDFKTQWHLNYSRRVLLFHSVINWGELTRSICVVCACVFMSFRVCSVIQSDWTSFYNQARSKFFYPARGSAFCTDFTIHFSIGRTTFLYCEGFVDWYNM